MNEQAACIYQHVNKTIFNVRAGYLALGYQDVLALEKIGEISQNWIEIGVARKER